MEVLHDLSLPDRPRQRPHGAATTVPTASWTSAWRWRRVPARPPPATVTVTPTPRSRAATATCGGRVHTALSTSVWPWPRGTSPSITVPLGRGYVIAVHASKG